MTIRRVVWGLLAAAVLFPGTAAGYFELDVEGGAAWSGYNDVAIPGNSGTKFSLRDKLDLTPAIAGRIRLRWHIDRRHSLTLMGAPLRIHGTGRADQDIQFNGSVFTNGSILDARYRFDSYRLSYRYTAQPHPLLQLGIGFTAKIRSASIRLDNGALSSERSDLGFVPLIKFWLDWEFHPRFGLLFEGDALAAPQGRAEDLTLALRYTLPTGISFRVGYRMVEGGSDNDSVYTFAWIHQVVFGTVIRL